MSRNAANIASEDIDSMLDTLSCDHIIDGSFWLSYDAPNRYICGHLIVI